MNQEEKKLIESLHRGDRYACNNLVEQFGSKIYNVALYLTKHPNEAEEILQETFIKACRGVEKFEGRSSLGTWLYRIATNNSLMYLRRHKTHTIPIDNLTSNEDTEFRPQQLHDWYWEPETIILTGELNKVMDEAVDLLPDKYRTAFVLRDLEGLSTKEAAEALEISSSNLKVRVHRARLLLREHLAVYFKERRSKP